MSHYTHFLRKRAAASLIILVVLLAASPSIVSAKGFDGRWVLTVTIPESPTSDAKRIFTINLDVSPRGDSLHGRMTITDATGRVVGGTWRQSGKKITISYELPCSAAESGACATLILQGRMKSSKNLFKKGDVIVMWDSANSNNPALYDTSNGSISGERLQE